MISAGPRTAVGISQHILEIRVSAGFRKRRCRLGASDEVAGRSRQRDDVGAVFLQIRDDLLLVGGAVVGCAPPVRERDRPLLRLRRYDRVGLPADLHRRGSKPAEPRQAAGALYCLSVLIGGFLLGDARGDHDDVALLRQQHLRVRISDRIPDCGGTSAQPGGEEDIPVVADRLDRSSNRGIVDVRLDVLRPQNGVTVLLGQDRIAAEQRAAAGADAERIAAALRERLRVRSRDTGEGEDVRVRFKDLSAHIAASRVRQTAGIADRQRGGLQLDRCKTGQVFTEDLLAHGVLIDIERELERIHVLLRNQVQLCPVHSRVLGCVHQIVPGDRFPVGRPDRDCRVGQTVVLRGHAAQAVMRNLYDVAVSDDLVAQRKQDIVCRLQRCVAVDQRALAAERYLGDDRRRVVIVEIGRPDVLLHREEDLQRRVADIELLTEMRMDELRLIAVLEVCKLLRPFSRSKSPTVHVRIMLGSPQVRFPRRIVDEPLNGDLLRMR